MFMFTLKNLARKGLMLYVKLQNDLTIPKPTSRLQNLMWSYNKMSYQVIKWPCIFIISLFSMRK